MLLNEKAYETLYIQIVKFFIFFLISTLNIVNKNTIY